MNLKLFYSPPKWKAFIAPEKPELGRYYTVALRAYEKAYAEAKANALEVGNPELIQHEYDRCLDIIKVEYEWLGSAVIKDGKYILSV